MSIVSVKKKYQVVIPTKVRKEAGIKVGDLLEAKAERGKVTFTPKFLLDRRIAEGLEDIRKGRISKAFGSGDDMVSAILGKSSTRSRKRKSKHSFR